MSYIIKFGDKYARFGSYGGYGLVDEPQHATIYTRLRDAQRRLNSRAGYPGAEIYEVTFKYKEKKYEPNS